MLNMRQERFFQEHNLGMVLLRQSARLVRPFAWVGHLPFAQVLIHLMQPSLIVELGSHTGNSFCAFCQAVDIGGLNTRCYAVDTWIGDEQAGYYGNDVYEELAQHVEKVYSGFATMLRMTFDEALAQFEAGSIDLLHIDGLHSYEAVHHDFDAWISKLSPRGVVLFHDTQVLDRGFGVHRVWSELRAKYAGFEFLHSHGLGVLLVGSDVVPAVRAFVDLANEDPDPLLALFERIALAGLPSAAIAYLRRFSRKPHNETVSIDCELYLDRGRGFNEEEKLIRTLDLEDDRGGIRFDLCRLSEGISRVRFDPGNEAIAFESITAQYQDTEGAWHQLDISSSSALSAGQNFLLFGDDPWVEFVLPPCQVYILEIEVRVKALGLAMIDLLVDCVKFIPSLRVEVEAHQKVEKQLLSDLAVKNCELAALRAEVEVCQKVEKQLSLDLATKDCDLVMLQQAVNNPLYRMLASVKLLPRLSPYKSESK